MLLLLLSLYIYSFVVRNDVVSTTFFPAICLEKMLCQAIFVVVECIVAELILTFIVLKNFRIILKLFDRLRVHFESSFIYKLYKYILNFNIFYKIGRT
jgi:hypothetical protein